MEILDVYRQVLRESVRSGAPDSDILWRMVALHTHSVVLRSGVAVENGGILRPGADGRVTLSPLTRSHLAALVAECWPAASERANDAYWLTAYAKETPYEVFEDVPNEERERAAAARDEIVRHDPIVELIAE